MNDIQKSDFSSKSDNCGISKTGAEHDGFGWDLHCHSSFSDGTCSPAELVEKAAQIGLSGVAITDHDTTAGWQQAAAAAQKLNFPLIRGTEITSHFGRVSVHILAWLYDPQNEAICALFDNLTKMRKERILLMTDKISKDYPIDREAVFACMKSGDETTPGRPHIADALVAAGVCENRSQAFASIISPKSPYYVPASSPDAVQVIKAVKNACGAVGIAHSGAICSRGPVLSEEQIEELADAGLDALEIFHRDNPEEQRIRLKKIAGRLNLLATAGSDWHGKGKINRMGENASDSETVREIVKRSFLTVAGM